MFKRWNARCGRFTRSTDVLCVYEFLGLNGPLTSKLASAAKLPTRTALAAKLPTRTTAEPPESDAAAVGRPPALQVRRRPPSSLLPPPVPPPPSPGPPCTYSRRQCAVLQVQAQPPSAQCSCSSEPPVRNHPGRQVQPLFVFCCCSYPKHSAHCSSEPPATSQCALRSAPASAQCSSRRCSVWLQQPTV
jgi:hypothetical protein